MRMEMPTAICALAGAEAKEATAIDKPRNKVLSKISLRTTGSLHRARCVPLGSAVRGVLAPILESAGDVLISPALWIGTPICAAGFGGLPILCGFVPNARLLNTVISIRANRTDRRKPPKDQALGISGQPLLLTDRAICLASGHKSGNLRQCRTSSCRFCPCARRISCSTPDWRPGGRAHRSA